MIGKFWDALIDPTLGIISDRTKSRFGRRRVFLLAGIIPLFELDAYATPVIMMEAVPGDTLDPAVEAKYRAAMGYEGTIERVERYAFYDRAKQAYACVISGETAKYGNIILKKGVTPIAK